MIAGQKYTEDFLKTLTLDKLAKIADEEFERARQEGIFDKLTLICQRLGRHEEGRSNTRIFTFTYRNERVKIMNHTYEYPGYIRVTVNGKQVSLSSVETGEEHFVYGDWVQGIDRHYHEALEIVEKERLANEHEAKMSQMNRILGF